MHAKTRWNGTPLPSCVAVLTFLAACSSGSAEAPAEPTITEDPERGTLTAEGTAVFRDTGLVDWVSFADAVAAVTVVDERQHEIPASVLDHEEGYVARSIEVQVDRLLWRPDHAQASFAINDTLEMVVFGWVLREGRLVAMAHRNSPRLEVGGQYVMPLVRFEPSWAPMTAESPIAALGSEVAADDVDVWHAVSPAREALATHSLDEMEALLAEVDPDPVAARHFDLPPEARISAVLSEGEP